MLNPAERYDGADLDFIYGLDYGRRHPGRAEFSPALRMNLFSVTAHRGCAGGCSFCSITQSEGRRVVSRSPESVLREIRSLAGHARVARRGLRYRRRRAPRCTAPTAAPPPAPALPACCRRRAGNSGAGEPYRDLLRRARALPGVKQVMLGSGVRHDLMLRNPDLLEEILREHCGRFLRVAPEHTEDEVLDLMGKPRFAVFEEFVAPVRAPEPRAAPAGRAGPLPDRRPSRARPPPWCRA